MATTVLPFNPTTAAAYLEIQNPEMLKRIDEQGYPYVEELFRNCAAGEFDRVARGQLTQIEQNDSDAFYLTRHAACVIAADRAPHA